MSPRSVGEGAVVESLGALGHFFFFFKRTFGPSKRPFEDFEL